MIDGKAQLIVDGAIPGFVVLDLVYIYIKKKQAEQAMMYKPVSSTLPWPLHQILPPGSCPVY